MMRSLIVCASLVVGLAPIASAEPYVFNTSQLSSSGVFSCMAAPACSASGSSVVLGTGDNAVTLTFTGVNTSVSMSNHVVPVTLGTLSASGSSGTFPARANPNQAIVRFDITLAQSSPVASSSSRRWSFGPGGTAALPFLLGDTYFSLNAGPVPAGYGRFVLSLSPHTFKIPLNGSVTLTANAGVVPEPGTMVLVALGLAGCVGGSVRARRNR